MERNSLAAQRQQRQVGRRLAESIRYKDSPCTVTSITVDGSSALCGKAVSTIERGDWNQSKLPLVFWCGHLDLACTRDMTHGCLLSLLACPAAQPLSFYATTYLIWVSEPPKSFASFGRGVRSSRGQQTPRDFRVQRGRDYGALTSPVRLKITHE